MNKEGILESIFFSTVTLDQIDGLEVFHISVANERSEQLNFVFFHAFLNRIYRVSIMQRKVSLNDANLSIVVKIDLLV